MKERLSYILNVTLFGVVIFFFVLMGQNQEENDTLGEEYQLELTELRRENQNLANTIQDLNFLLMRETDDDELSLQQVEMRSVAQRFSEYFTFFDSSQARLMRDQLLSVAQESVVNNIVTEQWVGVMEEMEHSHEHDKHHHEEDYYEEYEDNHNDMESDFDYMNPHAHGHAVMTQHYQSSRIYSYFVSPTHTQFFAIIDYIIELHGMQNTLQHHMIIDVQNVSGEFIVTNFEYVYVRP